MASVTTDQRLGINSSQAVKVPCRACSTSNITLSGEQTIDGVAVVTNDRVLVTGQTTASENGIYDADTGAWTRSPDWDGANDVVTGTIVRVTSGTSNYGYWAVTTTGTITPGTTSVVISATDGSTVFKGYVAANKADALTMPVVSGQSLFVVSADGSLFRAVTGAAPGTYTNNGGSYCGTVIVPTGGDGSAAWVSVNDHGRYEAIKFGLVADGATSDSTALSTAITAAVGGGYVDVPAGTSVLSSFSLPHPVSLQGVGPAHHAFYAAGDETDSVLLITGLVGEDLVSMGGADGGRGNTSLKDLSIYSAGSAVIQSVLRVSGTLHPYVEHVEINAHTNTNGVGLLLNGDGSANLTLWGEFIGIKVRGIDTALQITDDQNTNNFTGGLFSGKLLSFLIEGPVTPTIATHFSGTSFGVPYDSGMEHEWIAAGEQVQGVPENTAGYYVAKMGKLTAGDMTTFDGCYFECAGAPATYNDGTHGVLNLYPVIEVGTGVTNTEFNNCKWSSVYLLDRGTRTRADGFLTLPDYWTKRPPVLVRKTATATVIPATTYTTIPFELGTVEDSGNYSYSAGVVTILRKGFYEISALVGVENWAAAQVWGHLRITAGGVAFHGPNTPPDVGGRQSGLICETMLDLAVGDTIVAEAFTGEATTVIADSKYSRLMIKQL